MKPISKTAFYCCGVRMLDAEREKPVCGDVYAKVFMNEDGLKILEAFKNETRPNRSNVARHRIVDDLLRQELAANPDLLVVIIGAGFDTRAYRLNGGTWVELDEPQVIAYKNERLSASDSPNELQRIAIDFATESPGDKLAPFADRGGPVVVVVEGVFLYLEQPAIEQLLETLHRLFPHHKLICDLMTRKFFQKYGRTIRERLAGLGATVKLTAEHPEEIIVKNGYDLVNRFSIVEKSTEFEGQRVPKILFRTLLRTLASGYAIYVFEAKET